LRDSRAEAATFRTQAVEQLLVAICAAIPGLPNRLAESLGALRDLKDRAARMNARTDAVVESGRNELDKERHLLFGNRSVSRCEWLQDEAQPLARH